MFDRQVAEGPRSKARRPRASSESGFAYLLALAMMLMMLTASAVILMDMRTDGRRHREEDMIWRGREFTRAVRLYYRRAGHYPQNVDELEKGLVNIHFLRQEALVDPMNKDGDGKWRFIYTNPTGQIVGSVHYATMQQMAILDMNGGKVPAIPNGDADSFWSDSNQSQSSQSQSNQTQTTQTNQANQQDQSGTGVAPAGSTTTNANCPPASTTQTAGFGLSPTTGARSTGLGGGIGSTGMSGLQSQPFQLGSGSFSQNQPGTPGTTNNGCPNGLQIPGMPPGMTLASLQALLQMKPTGPVDSPVIGGFVIGVGSTVDRKSVKVYKTGKKYNEWEFIYNPIEEQALALQQGLSSGMGGAIGQLGQQLGLGAQPPGATGASPTQGSAPSTGLQLPPQTQQQQQQQ